MSKIIIALGGNALGETPKEQMELVKQTSKPIVDLIEEGHDIVIVHGNGPQVGMINLALETSSKSIAKTPEMPFAECGAMSQGYIGFHLQNAIREELLVRNIHKNVVSLITQVVVDSNDKAFNNPTKPVGRFVSKEEARILEEEKEYVMLEDSGRGYRRVVPSPKPVDVVEKDIIKSLIDDKNIVIACGGGGIPVIRNNNKLVGIDAVIDKDLASERLGEIIDADYLIILTAVEKVAINFGKEDEKWLEKVNTDEMKQYVSEGHFAPGSMLPKVEAGITFVESGEGRRTLITSLLKAKEAINGKTGTLIVK